nr:MarR family transcriptional regulator [uncultured Anaeromusa sp.]
MLLQRTVRTMQILERETIKTHGFTSSQCHMLLELLRSPGISMNELSEHMRLEISTVTRIMSNLVRDGLVRRSRSFQDKRVVEASLSEQGERVAQRLQTGIAAYYRDVICHLPRGHVREVMQAVEFLVDALEKAKE